VYLRARVSRNGRVTLPKPVRERLGLSPGDYLNYVVDKRGVRLGKETGHQVTEAFASFTEWASEADEAAYANL
jgi:antitoxin PrlF